MDQVGQRKQGRRKAWLRASLVALVAGLVPLAGASPAHATFPGPNGRIAFESDRAGGVEIFTANADGSDVQQVTVAKPNHIHLQPAWSPDGGTIAYVDIPFSANRQPSIRLIGADGSGDHLLINDPFFGQFQPSFSPDGTTILLDRCRPPGGPCTLYSIGADGKHLRNLLPFSLDGADIDGQYSPDGTQIALNVFYDKGGLGAIFLMDPDGSNLHRITSWARGGFLPDWSPDGSTIAFTNHCCDPRHSAVLAMNPDGSGVHRLTDPGQRHDFSPSYSPQGDRIAFERDTEDFSKGSVWTMAPDGSDQVKVITHAFDPAWGPAPSP
jgi:TolB protein